MLPHSNDAMKTMQNLAFLPVANDIYTEKLQSYFVANIIEKRSECAMYCVWWPNFLAPVQPIT